MKQTIKEEKNLKAESHYKRAKRMWVELFGELAESKKSWRLISLISMVINFILVLGIVMVSMKSSVVPYAVYINEESGQVGWVDKMDQLQVKDQRIIRSVLYRFIEQARSISFDPLILKKNLSGVYSMVTTPVAEHFLNPFYKKRDPFFVQKQYSIEVIPLVCLEESDSSYFIEWIEVKRNLEGKKVEKRKYKGWVSIEMKRSDSLQMMQKNPLGIYISRLSWSEVVA